MTTSLNPGQNQAVHHIKGPLLILAGAGSGKTKVVTHRIAYLLEQGIPSSEILAVTFTNKAAEEMKTRIRLLKNAYVLATTFHSLGARILRESIHFLGFKNTFTIYDADDSEKLLKSCLEELDLSGDKSVLKEAKMGISQAKNNLLEPDDESFTEDFSKIYRLYQKKLQSCDAVDFDDLLFLTSKILQLPDVGQSYQNRWTHVLIDEYQDTNQAQYTIAKLLVEKHQNIFAVGDPDQSIYSWRGAKYQNILNFEKDFPGAKIITLDQNYRSTNTILQAANALIEQNENRYEKKLWSNLGEGEKIQIHTAYNERQEAEFVASQVRQAMLYDEAPIDQIAIFYRTNAQSRAFEDALLSRKVPYTIIGGLSFYERKEIKDILAFLKLLISNSDLIAFLRTINIPKRGIGNASLEKIVHFSNLSQLPILSFLQEYLNNPNIALDLKLSPRQKESLKSYLRSIHVLRNSASQLKICDLIQSLLSEIGYLAYLNLDPETAQDRKENIDELLGKATEWEEEHSEPSLQLFLEEISLRVPSKEDPWTPTLKMMTLHNSKGLEFEYVFFVGLEEDLLPHINSKDDPKAVEEERRLCYVGMTRAKKRLTLSCSHFRYMWGTERMMRPSRFLKEIPLKFLKKI